jgi:chromate transporter
MTTSHGQSTISPPIEGAKPPSFDEALRTWFKIGCLSFGGPAGQIAMMHRILVEEKKWIDEARYLHA